jgi:hypothetical protein
MELDPAQVEKDREADDRHNKHWYGRYTTDPNKPQWGSRTFTNQQLSFEVDFEVFEQQFYARFTKKHHQKNRLSAATLWTEIISVIKGGLNSSDYYGGSLTSKAYITKFASPFLTKRER